MQSCCLYKVLNVQRLCLSYKDTAVAARIHNITVPTVSQRCCSSSSSSSAIEVGSQYSNRTCLSSPQTEKLRARPLCDRCRYPPDDGRYGDETDDEEGALSYSNSAVGGVLR
jgi:hypothetical protein